MPAATAYRERAARQGELGVRIAQWRHALDEHWHALHFGRVDVETHDGQRVFEVEVYLGELRPEDVHVELYAGGAPGESPVRQSMQWAESPGAEGVCVFAATVPRARSADEFTARVLPRHPGVSVPLEAPHILWQR